MKLSEAIKAGAKLRPQAFGSTYGKTEDGSLGTCAMGAAGEASGALVFVIRFGETVVKAYGHKAPFAVYGQKITALPCECAMERIGHIDGVSRFTVEWGIAHLNDDHRWRRELIAQWVKTLEDGAK